MECQSVFRRLSADLDEELPPAEAEAVRRHVLSCAGCARHRALLEKTRRAFRSAALEPVDPAFDAGVFRRLHNGHRLRWWLSAAAGSAAALGFVWLHSSTRPASVLVSGRSSAVAVSNAPAPPGYELQPGWRDGIVEAGADCARAGAVVCSVETPCRDVHCLPAAPVDLASVTAFP